MAEIPGSTTPTTRTPTRPLRASDATPADPAADATAAKPADADPAATRRTPTDALRLDTPADRRGTGELRLDGAEPLAGDIDARLAAGLQTVRSRTAPLVPPGADPAARARDAAKWAGDQVQALGALAGGQGLGTGPAAAATSASLLARPGQIAEQRAALQPIAGTPEGQRALQQLDALQQTLDDPGKRMMLEGNVRGTLIQGARNAVGLAAFPTAQAVADVQALARRDPSFAQPLQRAADNTARRMAENGPNAGLDRPELVAIAANRLQERAAGGDATAAGDREKVLRNAVQASADRHFQAGGASTPQEAQRRLDADIAAMQAAGVDAGSLATARQQVVSDPANQTMLQHPGLSWAGRRGAEVANLAGEALGVNEALDAAIGPRDPNRPTDGLGVLGHVTERIQPGQSREFRLDAEGRIGPVTLRAGTSIGIERTTPQGDPPSERLRVSFNVDAEAAIGIQREMERGNGLGTVNADVAVQAGVNGRVNFTYEFDTANPQDMARLRSMSDAIATNIPGLSHMVPADAPSVANAWQGFARNLASRTVEAGVTARVQANAAVTPNEQLAQARDAIDPAQEGEERPTELASLRLGGGIEAARGRTTHVPSGATTDTYTIGANGELAAASSELGATGGSREYRAQIAVERNAQGEITGVTLTRTYGKDTFAATAQQQTLTGELTPGTVATLERANQVEVTQRVDLAALGLPRDATPNEVAMALARHAVSPTPDPAIGPLGRPIARQTDRVEVRKDFLLASVAASVQRTQVTPLE